MTQHIRIFEQALSPEFCRKVIERFEADKRVQPDPQPDYSTRHYINASMCPEWADLNKEFCRATNAVLTAYFKRPDELAHAAYHEWSDDGYVVSRYRPGDTCVVHIDGQSASHLNNALRIATLIFYLNDVAEGGETYFPMQDAKVKPVTGRAVVFPVGYTHPHEVLPAQSDRYIMQSWITDPNFVVMLREDYEEAFGDELYDDDAFPDET